MMLVFPFEPLTCKSFLPHGILAKPEEKARPRLVPLPLKHSCFLACDLHGLAVLVGSIINPNKPLPKGPNSTSKFTAKKWPKTRFLRLHFSVKPSNQLLSTCLSLRGSTSESEHSRLHQVSWFFQWFLMVFHWFYTPIS